jgi:hypothetical protein
MHTVNLSIKERIKGYGKQQYERSRSIKADGCFVAVYKGRTSKGYFAFRVCGANYKRALYLLYQQTEVFRIYGDSRKLRNEEKGNGQV